MKLAPEIEIDQADPPRRRQPLGTFCLEAGDRPAGADKTEQEHRRAVFDDADDPASRHLPELAVDPVDPHRRQRAAPAIRHVDLSILRGVACIKATVVGPGEDWGDGS